MINPRDIEMQIDEAEEYLEAGQTQLARASFSMALSLLGQLAKQVAMAAKVGGPLVGVSVMEIVDALNDGLDHPLLNVVIGGLLGYFGGKKGSELFNSSLAPLWIRAYNGMGDVCRADSDFAQARKYYATALEASPNDPITRAKLAEVN